MKKIRRHMQSISLLMIAGILLVLAFYISQQTRSGNERPGLTATPLLDSSTLGDLPNCADVTSREEALACYTEAAQVSDALVMGAMDELLAMEPDTERRIALVETQIAWEESRLADCAFVRGTTADDLEGYLKEMICLRDHNVARFEQLEYYRCEWYDPEGCQGEGSTLE